MGGTIREEEDIEGLAIPQKKFQMHQTINPKELKQKQRLLEEENELLNVGLNMHPGYELKDMDASVIEALFTYLKLTPGLNYKRKNAQKEKGASNILDKQRVKLNRKSSLQY